MKPSWVWRRQNRETDAVLDGREARPENDTCSGPHREPPNSAGIGQCQEQTKQSKTKQSKAKQTRTESTTYKISKITLNEVDI